MRSGGNAENRPDRRLQTWSLRDYTIKVRKNMMDRELKKMKRPELLEILLRQNREIERLRQELESVKRQLADRQIQISEVGSLAEAALKLNSVFEAADAACRQYVDNIESRSRQQEQICREMERKTKEACDKMIEQAQRQAEAHWSQADDKIRHVLDETAGLKQLLLR